LRYQLDGSNVDVRLQVVVAEPRRRLKSFDLATDWEDLVAIPPTAPTTASAATIAPISTAATAALDFGTRFVHVQGASANLSAVQRRNGFLSIFPTGHFDEAEAARAPGIPVGHDADAVHLSVYLEKLPQFVFRSVEVEVANKDVLQASCL
jgi:hypothetical protein